MLLLRPLILTLLAMLLSTSVVFGWSDAGHKTVALIAWSKLNADTRTRIVALLAKHPHFAELFEAAMKTELAESASAEDKQRWLFAQAAIWPDLMRPPLDGSVNPNEKFHHSSWHYLDLPVFANAEAEKHLGPYLPKVNWEWQVPKAEFIQQRLNAAQALGKAVRVVPDAAQSDTERTTMLCWLFHLVGDAHQPCHCSSLFAVKLLPQGDRGGNSVLLKDMAAENLHSFWDELLGKKATLAEASQHATSIAGDAALTQKADASAAVLDPQAWITEGSAVAKASVYPPDIVAAVLSSESHSYEKNSYRYDAVGPLKLTPEQTTAYAANALVVARQQIAIAGVRLAKVLESLFHP